MLERNAVRDSRVVAGWHCSFGPERENIKSREDEFQLVLRVQLAALLGFWQCWQNWDCLFPVQRNQWKEFYSFR